MKTVTIGKNDAGQRLDRFLTKRFPHLPVSLLYKAIRKKDVKCNGRRCHIDDRLAEKRRTDPIYQRRTVGHRTGTVRLYESAGKTVDFIRRRKHFAAG